MTRPYRYLILWAHRGCKPFTHEAPLPKGESACEEYIAEHYENFELIEVREVETGRDVTDLFEPKPKPTPEGRADIWIKERKEERAFS